MRDFFLSIAHWLLLAVGVYVFLLVVVATVVIHREVPWAYWKVLKALWKR